MEYRDLTPSEISDEAIRRMMMDSKDGASLPPERDLGNQLGISRTTLRGSLMKLKSEGEVISHARGSLVNKKMNLNMLAMQSMTQELRHEGKSICVKTIEAVRSDGSTHVQKFFNIEGKGQLFELHRSRIVNGTPFTYEVTYLQLSKFPHIESLDLNNASLYKTLADKYDAHPSYGREEMSAILATAEIAKVLNVDVGTPLFKVRSLTYDENDEPFEYSTQYLVGSDARYVLSASNIFDYQEDEEE
jgi:DNA-binding GntR family transcriptional regulator